MTDKTRETARENGAKEYEALFQGMGNANGLAVCSSADEGRIEHGRGQIEVGYGDMLRR